MLPISATGWIVPSSLFASITDTSAVSGRIAAATSSALIYVGILMLGGLKRIDFDDLSQALPAALMLICMPISGSIGHGIGIAMISYTVIKVFSGRAKDVSVLTYVISLLFIIKFFAVV